MILKDVGLAALGRRLPSRKSNIFANEELSTIRMQYAVIGRHARLGEAAASPAMINIRKQYELYKDIVATPVGSDSPPPTIDGHTYPFGYKYPDRVKVEFLKFDRTAILSRLQADARGLSGSLQILLRAPFRISQGWRSATSLTVGTQQPFEEVREKLVKDQVAARRQVSQAGDRSRSGDSETAVEQRKAGRGGYRETVPRDKWVDYKTLAERPWTE